MMQTEMRKRQISVEWHPFLMVESYNVDLTKYKVQMLRRQMDRIMENGRKNYLECCCPCCVLSDVNENGHKINLEQKIKTIIMLMIFQDTDCEDKEKTQGVLLPDKFHLSWHHIPSPSRIRGYGCGVFLLLEDPDFSYAPAVH